MSVDVHTIGQPAHHEHVGEEAPEVGTEVLAEVFAVGRDASRAHHRQHVLRIEVGVAAIEHHGRSIGTFGQALRIVRVVQAERTDVVTFAKFQFARSARQCLASMRLQRRLDAPPHSGVHLGEDIVGAFEDSACIGHMAQQLKCLCLGHAAQKTEGQGV